MLLDKDILRFLFQHQYDLKKVSEDEKKFVQDNKKTILAIPDDESIRPLLILKYPGLIFSDSTFVYKYSEKIYKPLYDTVMTPPRGYVDKSSILVVGIAPGFSVHSFGESNWQYGPSSKVLHELLNFDYRWYFTNVCKEYFFKNLYNETMVKQYYPDILKELQFFDGQRILFLGNYPIYKKLINDLETKAYLQIIHPSATKYLRTEDLIRLKEEVRRFVQNE